MQVFEDGDEVELMTTFNRGEGVPSIPRETRGTVFGPQRGMGNYSGTGQALISFEGFGVYNLPETWLIIIKKKTTAISGAHE